MTQKHSSATCIYPAYSKQKFFLREHISKFLLKKGITPLNPFMNFGYFLGDSIDRTKVYAANSQLIRLADGIWVFGEVSDGVAAEIELCESELGKHVRYFDIFKSQDGFYSFIEIDKANVKNEQNTETI